MRDLPKITIDSIYDIVKEKEGKTLNISLFEYRKRALAISMQHGFGSIVTEIVDGEEVHFISSVQALMIVSLFNISTRMRLIKSLLELSEIGLDEVISAKVHRQRHRYREYRKLERTYQPLVNLINPSFDIETSEATLFLTTRMVNKLMGTSHSCVEVRQRLVRDGYMDGLSRPNVRGIRSVFNYIELGEEMELPGCDNPVKTIKVPGIIFDKLTVGFMKNLFLEDKK